MSKSPLNLLQHRFVHRWAALKQFLLVPLLAFSLMCLSTLMVAFSLQRNGLRATEFVRWDSEHYLAIATTGYALFPCTALEHYPPELWCGNTGWLPGYPLLINLFRHLDLAGPVAGVLLSHTFLFLTFLLLWQGFFAGTLTVSSFNSLLLVVVFPGSIYYQAVFPISMFLFFVFLSFYLLQTARWLWAGVAGFLSAFTYATGFLLALVFAFLLADRAKPVTVRLTTVLTVSGLTVLGFATVLGVQAGMVGAWDAFFKVQAKYGHGLHNPLTPFRKALRSVLRLDWENPLFMAHLQTVLIVGLLLTLLYTYKASWPQSQVERLVLSYSLIFWFFPLLLGQGVNLYRQESLLLPLTLLFHRLPVYMQLSILVLFCFLKFPMSVLFFRGVLV
jgi:hypothetical protein